MVLGFFSLDLSLGMLEGYIIFYPFLTSIFLQSPQMLGPQTLDLLNIRNKINTLHIKEQLLYVYKSCSKSIFYCLECITCTTTLLHPHSIVQPPFHIIIQSVQVIDRQIYIQDRQINRDICRIEIDRYTHYSIVQPPFHIIIQSVQVMIDRSTFRIDRQVGWQDRHRQIDRQYIDRQIYRYTHYSIVYSHTFT